MQTLIAGWISKYALGAVVAALAAIIVLWYNKNKIVIAQRSLTLEEWIEAKLKVNIDDGYRQGVLAWIENTFGDARSVRQTLRTIYSFFTNPDKQKALETELQNLIETWGDKWVNHLDGASASLKLATNLTKENIAVRIIGTNEPEKTGPEIRKSIQLLAPATIADKPSEPVSGRDFQAMVAETKKKLLGEIAKLDGAKK
jgi:hypothetical protein